MGARRKPATVAEAIQLLRRADDGGTIEVDGRYMSIEQALRAAGVTPWQAARAARRLGWTDSPLE